MLDEVDKIGMDFRDPSGTFEVLDGAELVFQRSLPGSARPSKVMFIATTYLDQIPPALRDRMEVLDFQLGEEG
jgi:ATP-dependent Lon protease